ncbi:MAG: phosphoribosylglycinamide formyltransferase [Calditrichaeota bacterium]|nr:MAG: phosphoribosylglycinamide formyltransferase [Calditrichota bacterium]
MNLSSNFPIAVFISGSGSNFIAIDQAIQRGEINGHIACVVSSTEKAGGLNYAKENRIDHFTPPGNIFKNDVELAALLQQKMRAYKVKLVVLAGFLKKIPAEFINDFAGQIINIHPALLPSFGGKGMYGKYVHEAVLAYGCKISGATVHLVNSDYDTGPPLIQKSVPVLNDDSAETLAARVLKIEHEILPKAVSYFANNAVEINGRSVQIIPK